MASPPFSSSSATLDTTHYHIIEITSFIVIFVFLGFCFYVVYITILAVFSESETDKKENFPLRDIELERLQPAGGSIQDNSDGDNIRASSSTNLPEEDSSLLYIPDDLLLSCFARTSVLYYPTLSLVSKKFRSLLASVELYKFRALLNRKESCLYVWFSHWFTLCRRPTRVPNVTISPSPDPNPITKNIRKKERSPSDNILVSLQTDNFFPWMWWKLATIGDNIYMIGGRIDGEFSTRIFYMDCRSHTWHEAPSMQIAHKYPKVNVLDEKLYVREGWVDYDSSKPVEVFDPKTQTWEYLPTPNREICGTYAVTSVAINGKLYLIGDKTLVYNPKENRWDAEEGEMDLLSLETVSDSHCVIDNVLYSCGVNRMVKWYNFETRFWKSLKGLKGLPKLPNNPNKFRLMNYGGKMMVIWEKNKSTIGYEKMIWCAQIALERHKGHEIIGKVEWCDVVITVPLSFHLLDIVVAAV